MHVTPINLKPMVAVGKFKSPKLKVKQRSYSIEKRFIYPQQKVKNSVDLFSLPIKSDGHEKQKNRKDLAKRESLKPDTPEKKPARNQAGFSNLSNLKARRSRRKKKQEDPGSFQITMKKLQNLEISKSQTKAIGREEVS